MKINGWKRIGIIASVLWILGASYITYDYAQRTDLEWNANVFIACTDAEPENTGHQECANQSYARQAQDVVNERELAAEVAVTTTALAWGFAYLVIFLVHWVKRGFEIEEQAGKKP